jgi:hypothetical protein
VVTLTFIPAGGKLPQDQHPLPIHLKGCETSSPLNLQEHHHSEIDTREAHLIHIKYFCLCSFPHTSISDLMPKQQTAKMHEGLDVNLYI